MFFILSFFDDKNFNRILSLKSFLDIIKCFSGLIEFFDFELTNIDLYAYKKGVPYPMVVPLFPILTNKNEIDYGKEFNF